MNHLSPFKNLKSDHHFGAPTKAASKPREERFIAWLDRIKLMQVVMRQRNWSQCDVGARWGFVPRHRKNV